MPFTTPRARLTSVALGLALLTSACGGGGATGEGTGLTGTIQIDGSSTVAPLSEAAAELFQDENSEVSVVVGTSGTGGGFEKFCAGEKDISNASRPIKDKEIAACKAKGIEFEQITVANDGLAVVVNPDNPIDCLTTEQLTTIWKPGSKVTNLKQVDPSFPDVGLKLFGAGTDSGTFDYFTAEINGEEGAIRTDYEPSEDDNITVQGVKGNPGGMGFMGLSYVEENPDAMKALAINSGSGCVKPSAETVLDGTYKPLGRPLFIYASKQLVARPEGLAFLRFYVDNSEQIAKDALYVPLSAKQKADAEAKIASLAS